MRIANQGTTLEAAKEYVARRRLTVYQNMGLKYGVPSEEEARIEEDKRLGVILTPLSPEEATPGIVYTPGIIEAISLWWAVIPVRLIGLLMKPIIHQFFKKQSHGFTGTYQA